MKKYHVYAFLLLVSLCPFKSLAYSVNTGDVLHLEVYGEPELAIDVTVDSLGFIEYPFVGKIKVAGREVEMIRSEVVKKLKNGYFVSPQVMVFVKKYKPFFIQGEVVSPGSYAYEEGLTVRKAIALAGGLTERASKKKIYLTRAGMNAKDEMKVTMDQEIASGDVIQIKESFF
ncbi:MAG: polysaccharide export protein [Alcanivoracaceae bacterium]|nr:polysaccharide export protein [Alcanivoracaceae bacterium]